MNELLWYFCTQGIGSNEDRKQLRQEITHTLKIIKEIRGKTEMEFIFRVPFGCFSTLSTSRDNKTITIGKGDGRTLEFGILR